MQSSVILVYLTPRRATKLQPFSREKTGNKLSTVGNRSPVTISHFPAYHPYRKLGWCELRPSFCEGSRRHPWIQ
jgi:hypothetical protein